MSDLAWRLVADIAFAVAMAAIAFALAWRSLKEARTRRACLSNGPLPPFWYL